MITNVYDLVSVHILNTLGAIVILLFGLVFGRFFSKLIKKGLKSLEIDKALRKETLFLSDKLMINGVKYLVYIIALILALNQIGIRKTAFYLVLIVLILIIVIFVLLSIRDLVPNFSSGLKISRENLVKRDKDYKIGKINGKVVNIGLLETKMKTKQGFIYIPNKLVLTKLKKK
ncbi:mechanosensitive ion channel [archaeon]|nr:mechanosensitive ion channel [archaeon]